mmetsp:Transcript_62262/g.167926  ORF Transcript_62262/g.167926 Transcript_62262/m.167926 type:complete len:460 (-) Transcript_62262:801-2180(-)
MAPEHAQRLRGGGVVPRAQQRGRTAAVRIARARRRHLEPRLRRAERALHAGWARLAGRVALLRRVGARGAAAVAAVDGARELRGQHPWATGAQARSLAGERAGLAADAVAHALASLRVTHRAIVAGRGAHLFREATRQAGRGRHRARPGHVGTLRGGLASRRARGRLERAHRAVKALGVLLGSVPAGGAGGAAGDRPLVLLAAAAGLGPIRWHLAGAVREEQRRREGDRAAGAIELPHAPELRPLQVHDVVRRQPVADGVECDAPGEPLELRGEDRVPQRVPRDVCSAQPSGEQVADRHEECRHRVENEGVVDLRVQDLEVLEEGGLAVGLRGHARDPQPVAGEVGPEAVPRRGLVAGPLRHRQQADHATHALRQGGPVIAALHKDRRLWAGRREGQLVVGDPQQAVHRACGLGEEPHRLGAHQPLLVEGAQDGPHGPLVPGAHEDAGLGEHRRDLLRH